jgi:hypothetical protein
MYRPGGTSAAIAELAATATNPATASNSCFMLISRVLARWPVV